MSPSIPDPTGSTEPAVPKTVRVQWAESAVREAVERVATAIRDGGADGVLYDVGGQPLAYMDLAALVDATRTLLAHDCPEPAVSPAPDTDADLRDLVADEIGRHLPNPVTGQEANRQEALYFGLARKLEQREAGLRADLDRARAELTEAQRQARLWKLMAAARGESRDVYVEQLNLAIEGLEEYQRELARSAGARTIPDGAAGEVRALLVHPAAWNGLVAWLTARGLTVDGAGDLEDIPTYSMGISDELAARPPLATALGRQFMRLCSACGSKRCPGANGQPCDANSEPTAPQAPAQPTDDDHLALAVRYPRVLADYDAQVRWADGPDDDYGDNLGGWNPARPSAPAVDGDTPTATAPEES